MSAGAGRFRRHSRWLCRIRSDPHSRRRGVPPGGSAAALAKRKACDGKTDRSSTTPRGRSSRWPWSLTVFWTSFAAANWDKPDVSILSEEFFAEVRVIRQPLALIGASGVCLPNLHHVWEH